MKVSFQRAVTSSGLALPALPSDGNTVFVLDPDDLDATATHQRLTLSGSSVTACADANGGSIVLGPNANGSMTWDPAVTINGHPTIYSTSAGGEGLSTTTGGPTWGSSAWTMYTVGNLKNYADTSYPSLGIIGQPDKVNLHVATMGAYGSAWWGGFFDGTTDALSSVTPDSNPCLLSLTYDGAGTVTLRRNGVKIASHAVTGTPALPKGFGIGPWYMQAGFYGGVRVAWSMWRQGADIRAVRQQIEQYTAQRYGLLQKDLVACIGDSLTAGIGATTSYPTALSNALSTSWNPTVINAAVQGFTTANTISNITTPASYDVVSPPSGCRRMNLAVLFIGTNDITTNAAPPATTIANITTIKSMLEALGYTVLCGTLYPWINGAGGAIWVQSYADQINTAIRALFPSKRVIEFATMPQMAIVGGAYQAQYRNTVSNIGHPTDQGYAAMANLVESALWVNRQ